MNIDPCSQKVLLKIWPKLLKIGKMESNLRPQSPLGLARHSRMAEKAELQNLNDRLACYIDRVRFLETENSRLIHEVQAIFESQTKEKANIKRKYESELGNVRKALDESAKDKTRLEIETNRLNEENANLKNHLEKKTKELTDAQSFEPKYSDLLVMYNKIDGDLKKALDTNNELEKMIANLNSVLTDMRKHLEDETLARVEAENKAQSLREELAFASQIDHIQEMDVEKHSTASNITDDADNNLENSLRQLRDQYEATMRANREEIDTFYKTQLESLQAEAVRASELATNAIEEIRNSGHRISSLNAKISELEGQTFSQLSRIRDLESMLDNSIRQRGEDQTVIQRLREEMTQQIQEYQDLMDLKVSLDLEIAAYNELLSGEEQRFESSEPVSNIHLENTSSGNPSRAISGDGEIIPRKRKRTSSNDEMDHIRADLEIQGSCSDGRFVRVYNKGDNTIAIGGWQLKQIVGETEAIYKFRRSIMIEPKGSITVWSATANAQHEPPANIVMKRNWIAGKISQTQLFNGDQEEMASAEHKQNGSKIIKVE